MIFPTFFKTRAISTGCLILSLSAGAVTAYAKDVVFPKKSFRAEINIMAEGAVTPAVLYGQGPLMRLELSQGGNEMVQIMNMEEGEAFMMMEVGFKNTAMRLKIDDAMSRLGLTTKEYGRATGTKKIAGEKCKIYVVDATKICLSKHNITLESVSADSSMHVTKLEIGRQKASLFKVPNGYKIMDMGGVSGGMSSSTFGSSDGILGAVLGQANQNSIDNTGEGIPDLSGLIGGINKVVDAKDDDAAGQASLDAMLQQMGMSAGSITKNDTTAGILGGVINNGKSAEDHAKEKALMSENERRMKLVESGGIAALLRDGGASDAQISEMDRQGEMMRKKIQAHADKHEGKISDGIASAPSEANTIDLEAELEIVNARAEAAVKNGTVSEADRKRLQKDAEDTLQRILGKLPKK